ncbi:thioredoxin-like protein [Marasmius fiardii PR-910]|nr:thioredoxin-like protein [Marasmius fiardii PR-910]
MASLATTTIRRRRFITLILAVLIVVLLFVRTSEFELPEVLKDAGVPLSKGNFAHVMKEKLRFSQTEVNEIYGLIHLVTNDDHEHQHVLSQSPKFDPTKPVDMKLYAPGEEDEVDWGKEVEMLNERYPVVVFSKSFCPYSRRAKKLLDSYGLRPPPKVIEVDLRDDSTQIKAILTRLTQRQTFPNVIVKGKSIGGSDDIHHLHTEKDLKRIFEKAGVQVTITDIVEE